LDIGINWTKNPVFKLQAHLFFPLAQGKLEIRKTKDNNSTRTTNHVN